jgi:hypothetical protein
MIRTGMRYGEELEERLAQEREAMEVERQEVEAMDRAMLEEEWRLRDLVEPYPQPDNTSDIFRQTIGGTPQ